MRAAFIDRFGAPEVVRVVDLAKPAPNAGELLVRVHATTVSVADQRLRSRRIPRGLSLAVAPVIGLFRPRKHVLGMEASGVVESVGAGVTGFAPGDEVVLMRGSAMGCHAEYVTVAADGEVARKPANLSFDDAAAVIFGGHTALRYLDGVRVGEGTEVLVNGASGAVGTALVQLAAARGATVTAVTSGGNADLVRSLGATHVIDYTREDFAARLRQLGPTAPASAVEGGADDRTWRGDAAADGRYDVIADCVGNAPFARVAHLLRPGGALLLVIADLRGMLTADWHARRSGRIVDQRGGAPGADLMARVAALAESGELKPVIDRTYDLDEIVEAHRYVDTGRKRGSVVVQLG